MTDNEVQQVKKYREQGETYARIAEIMNLPVGTVKTWCRRNNLIYMDRTSQCMNCGKKLELLPGTKKKKFCSDKCRMHWWYKNQELAKNRINFKITCVNCGQTFISYGNKNRKYCSRKCYISGRYGDRD